jgi:hypothetical protein
MADVYYLRGPRTIALVGITTMKTLSLKLPEAVAARLAAAARKQSQSKSAVVRAILDRCLTEDESAEKGSCLDLAADLAGCVAGPSDLSTQKRHLQGYGK